MERLTPSRLGFGVGGGLLQMLCMTPFLEELRMVPPPFPPSAQVGQTTRGTIRGWFCSFAILHFLFPFTLAIGPTFPFRFLFGGPGRREVTQGERPAPLATDDLAFFLAVLPRYDVSEKRDAIPLFFLALFLFVAWASLSRKDSFCASQIHPSDESFAYCPLSPP